jgi:hypothetical protein
MTAATTAIGLSQELVRFLLARVDEDESVLKRMRKRLDRGGDGIASIDRMQADVAARRKLVGCLQQLLVLRDQPCEKPVRDQANQMLRVLAAPYNQHHGYRLEWRPSGSH